MDKIVAPVPFFFVYVIVTCSAQQNGPLNLVNINYFKEGCLVPCRITCSAFSQGCSLRNCRRCLDSCEDVCSANSNQFILPDILGLGETYNFVLDNSERLTSLLSQGSSSVRALLNEALPGLESLLNPPEPTTPKPRPPQRQKGLLESLLPINWGNSAQSSKTRSYSSQPSSNRGYSSRRGSSYQPPWQQRKPTEPKRKAPAANSALQAWTNLWRGGSTADDKRQEKPKETENTWRAPWGVPSSRKKPSKEIKTTERQESSSKEKQNDGVKVPVLPWHEVLQPPNKETEEAARRLGKALGQLLSNYTLPLLQSVGSAIRNGTGALDESNKKSRDKNAEADETKAINNFDNVAKSTAASETKPESEVIEEKEEPTTDYDVNATEISIALDHNLEVETKIDTTEVSTTKYDDNATEIYTSLNLDDHEEGTINGDLYEVPESTSKYDTNATDISPDLDKSTEEEISKMFADPTTDYDVNATDLHFPQEDINDIYVAEVPTAQEYDVGTTDIAAVSDSNSNDEISEIDIVGVDVSATEIANISDLHPTNAMSEGTGIPTTEFDANTTYVAGVSGLQTNDELGDVFEDLVTGYNKSNVTEYPAVQDADLVNETNDLDLPLTSDYDRGLADVGHQDINTTDGQDNNVKVSPVDGDFNATESTTSSSINSQDDLSWAPEDQATYYYDSSTEMGIEHTVLLENSTSIEVEVEFEDFNELAADFDIPPEVREIFEDLNVTESSPLV